MAEEDISLDNINLSIISRINDSVDLSDADKKTLIKLVMVRSKGSVDINKVKEQARREAIEEYKREHREFIDRIKQEIVEDIIRMVSAGDSGNFDDFIFDHQINSKELVAKIRAKYPKK